MTQRSAIGVTFQVHRRVEMDAQAREESHRGELIRQGTEAEDATP